MRKRDRRRLIGARSPGCRLGRTETLIEKTKWHQLAPDMTGALGTFEMHSRTMVVDRDFYRPDPLRHFRFLVVTIRRLRQLGSFLGETSQSKKRRTKEGEAGRFHRYVGLLKRAI